MTIIATLTNESAKLHFTSNNHVEYDGDMEIKRGELFSWWSSEGQLSLQKVIWQGNISVKGWNCSNSVELRLAWSLESMFFYAQFFSSRLPNQKTLAICCEGIFHLFWSK